MIAEEAHKPTKRAHDILDPLYPQTQLTQLYLRICLKKSVLFSLL